ncbi:DUF5010 C-terminal domain-containing protein [Pontiellaceae bacterium B12219]|nr:DUF5010 C-terminal domain-containing protein [Pontiellaceae bacterium B12219]
MKMDMQVGRAGLMAAALLVWVNHTQAAPYHYWNGAVSTNWHEAGNWTVTNPAGASAVPTLGDVAYINEVPENIPTLSTTEQALTLRVAYASGTTGILNIIDGADLTVASNLDRVGNGGHGTVNQSGGTIELNRLQLGNGTGAYGEWNLSGGTFKIKNSATLCGLSGISLGIGDQGAGFFNLSGGTVTTRGGIALGGTTGGSGTFNIFGEGTVNCGDTDASDSGAWYQNTGSTLSAEVDSGNGFSLGQIVLFDGSADDPSVTFESGSILNVSFSGADYGAGTRSWDLMTWPESTTVVNEGLTFGPGVNLDIWSFAITNNALRLTYEREGARFVHPGMSHKRSDLDRMKAMVEAQIDPWYSSYQTMCSESKANYTYTVQGDTSMKVLYRSSPGTNLSEFESDSRAAYYNALRWYIEGDSRYADKAVEIFNAWTGLEYLDHSGTRALTSCLIYQMLEAAEIIKSTYSGWSDEEIQAFKDMLVYPGYSNTEAPENLMVAYEDGGEGTWYWRAYMFDYVRAGNQEASAMRACMALGIFLDNEIIYDRALRYAKGLPHRDDDLPYASGPHTTGSVSSSNEYQISYNYTIGYDIEDYGFEGVLTNYIWETGQAAESSRDPWHTWWGMHLLACMGEMAWSQGDNFWGEADSRILLGMEYHNKWSVSYLYAYPDQPAEWTPTAESGEFLQRFTRTGRTFTLAINPYYGSDTSRFYRTKYNDVAMWEHALGHYYGRGLKTADEVKWTTRARDTSIERNGNYETKPSSGNGSYLGYGGLTYRRPDYCYGDPVSGFYTNGVPIFGMNELPGTVEAELFDYMPVDANGRTYTSVAAGGTNDFRPEQDFQIVEKPGGGHALGQLEAGEWLSYTVHVPTTGTYKVAVDYAASSSGKIRFWIDGRDLTGDIILPITGSSSNWVDYTVAQHLTLSNRVQSLRVYISEGSFSLDSISIEEDTGGSGSVLPPTGLSAMPEDAASIHLIWNAADGASQYNLKRATVSGGVYDVMAIGAGSTSHTDGGLLAGTNYYYVISAVYDGTESSNSQEVVAVPSALIHPGDVMW